MRRQLQLAEFNLLQNQAEHIVELFRSQFGFPNEAPVPVEMIAQALFGLRCEPRDLADAVMRSVGALSVENATIYVDERCSRRQYSFVVAHETGHWVFHSGNFALHLRFVGTPSIPLSHFLGSTRARTPEARSRLQEIEANSFAAALLIPRPFLFSRARECEVIDEEAVVRLASDFHVSRKAMVYRIRNLSRHLEWTGPHIKWDSLDRLESTLARGWHAGLDTALLRVPSSLSKDEAIPPDAGSDLGAPSAIPAREGEGTEMFHLLIQSAVGQSARRSSSSEAGRSRGVDARQAGDESFVDSFGRMGQRIAKVCVDYRRRQLGDHVPARDRQEPVIVEFAGTPNSGKDTLIEVVKSYLEDAHGYRVRVFDEGVKFCHMDKQLQVDRLYKTVALAVMQLYEARFENPGDYDFVLFNRGVFDRLAFLHTMKVRDQISERQEQVHLDYLLSYANLQDMTFLFLISAEESIRREEEKGRSSVYELLSEDHPETEGQVAGQSILNLDVLAQLNDSYLRMFESFKGSFNNQIYLLDFTGGDDATVLQKARALLDAALPRAVRQLPLPELFGVYYACTKPSSHRERARRRDSRQRPRAEARQLQLFGDRTTLSRGVRRST